MSVMYIGPDLKGIVNRNQIFTYYPDEIIKRACEVNSLTRHLFVDMDNIVASKRELRTEGSLLFLAYKKVAKNGGRPWKIINMV